MQTNADLLPANKVVSSAVQRVLRNRLRRLGFQRADIYEGRDHDGDPVLYIDAHHAYSDKPIDPSPTFEIITALRQELAKIGETRFPHIRHRFDERQTVQGW